MSDTLAWTRTQWADAALLAEQIDPDNVPADAAGVPPHEWFNRLSEGGTLHTAVMFLAHALPRYECVVWGAQALMTLEAIDRLDPMVVAVLRWVDQPGDALRREAGELAERARKDTPARLLALAVMYSGGSVAPAEYAPILPPNGACAALVGAAILKGAGASGDYAARVRTALARGQAIACGA